MGRSTGSAGSDTTMKNVHAHHQHSWRLAMVLVFLAGGLLWSGGVFAQSTDEEQVADQRKDQDVSTTSGEEVEPVKVEPIRGRKRVIRAQPEDSASDDEVIASYDLKVEFVKPTDGGRVQVLLNGESVNPPTAAMLMRVIRMQESVKMQRLDGSPEEVFPDGSEHGPPGHLDRMNDHQMQPQNGHMRRGENGRGGPPDGFLGPNMDRQRGGWFHPPVELTPELIDVVLTVIKDFDRPEVYVFLTELQAGASEEVFSKALGRSSSRWKTEIDLYQNDRELYDLRLADYTFQNRTVELQFAHRQAMDKGDEETAQVIAEELEGVVGEHFDVRQKQREREVERLMGEVEKLRQRVERRLERRDEIIQSQMNRLLGDPNEF